MKGRRSGRAPVNPDETTTGPYGRGHGAPSFRTRTMSHPNLPITEVLVVADCWRREPDSEAVIQRAVAAAAENVDEDVAEAEVAGGSAGGVVDAPPGHDLALQRQ